MNNRNYTLPVISAIPLFFLPGTVKSVHIAIAVIVLVVTLLFFRTSMPEPKKEILLIDRLIGTTNSTSFSYTVPMNCLVFVFAVYGHKIKGHK